MVVVVIAALLFTVLLLFVFPSDDRRCRLEAERLAAYMTSASAEAVMREGGSRVVFTLADGTAEREVSRDSADLSAAQWASDPRASKYKVRQPVKVDSINTPAVPELTMGVGYVVFEGRNTEGAVVVLVLEDAIYSVVVPPSSGDIKVQKGRSPIPGAMQYETPKIPDLTGYVKNSKGLASNLAGAGVPPPMAINRRPPPKRSRVNRKKNANRRSTAKPRRRAKAPAADSPGPPARSRSRSSRRNSKKSKTRRSPSRKRKSKSVSRTSKTSTRTSPVNQQPLDPLSCRNLTDCVGRGAWLVCLGGRCVPEWRRRSVILVDAQVTQPEVLAPVLDTMLHDLITSGELNVIMNLNQPQSFLIQGSRLGSADGFARYAQHEEMPAYPTAGPSTDNPFNGLFQCVGISCQGTFTPEGDEAEMTLFIRDDSASANACQYQTLTLINVTVDLEADLSQLIAETSMTLRGTLRRSSARRFIINDDLSLADFMADSDVAPNADSIGDGVPDSWEFEFSGPGSEILFSGNAAANTDVMPENCE